MNELSNNLDSTIRLADAASAARELPALNATTITESANTRRRKRWAGRTLGSAAMIVALVTGAMHLAPSEKLTARQPTSETLPSIAQLTADIEALVAETDALVARLRANSPTPEEIALRAEMATIDELMQEERLARLKSQLADLEREAADSAELKWATEWSRSGALRLELTRLDPDPERAARSYQQIATTYADSRWGKEAKLALSEEM